MNASTPVRARRWYAVAAVTIALAAFGVIAAGGIGDNLVYYWGPAEIAQHGDQAIGATIRLGGHVVPGSIVMGQGAGTLEFDVSDETSKVHVKASGVPPQMFRENIGVVVEGTMTREGYFAGNRLMVSHDNEYRDAKEGEPDPHANLPKKDA